MLAPAPPKVENPKVHFLEEVKEPEPVVVTRTCTKEEKEEIKNLVKKTMTTKCSWDESSSDEEDDEDDEEEEEEKPVIPQAPKVLKPILLKSNKPVVAKIEEKDMPIIRKGPSVAAPKPAPVPKPAPKPVQKPVQNKQKVMQIELKDAWSDDEA